MILNKRFIKSFLQTAFYGCFFNLKRFLVFFGNEQNLHSAASFIVHKMNINIIFMFLILIQIISKYNCFSKFNFIKYKIRIIFLKTDGKHELFSE